MTQILPDYCNLGDLLSKRLFKIPEYQRAYSWENKQRQDLFEDIRQSYLAGNDREHFMATIVGLRREKRLVITDEHQVIEVVDGQQRITTLVLLLKAIFKALDPSDVNEARIRTDIHETLVKPDNASLLLLQTNHDTSRYFEDYITQGKHPAPRTANTLADRHLLTAIRNCETFVSEWQASGHSLTDLVSHLKNRLTFIFHELGDEFSVYSVFEVLNSRGLAVSWFDRLKSMLMAVVFESETGNKNELIQQIHTLWADIYRTVGLRIGTSTESLRFAATLRSLNRPSKALNEEEAVASLLQQSQTPADAIDTSRWLLSVTKSVDMLMKDNRRTAVTQIAHARLMAVAVNLRNDLKRKDKEAVLSRWENVTFRVID